MIGLELVPVIDTFLARVEIGGMRQVRVRRVHTGRIKFE